MPRTFVQLSTLKRNQRFELYNSVEAKPVDNNQPVDLEPGSILTINEIKFNNGQEFICSLDTQGYTTMQVTIIDPEDVMVYQL